MTDKRSERLRRRRQRRHQSATDLEVPSPGWKCGIGSCSYIGETVTDLVTHQARDHPLHTCKICHRDIPNGFIAIYHTFEEHSRTEYIKAYDASPDDVKQREQIKAGIERQIDVHALFQRIYAGNGSRNP